MEKKLTDEELQQEKSFKELCEKYYKADKGYSDYLAHGGSGCDDEEEWLYQTRDIINFIHRLQDENAELQKQVDELKEERQTLVDKYNKADEAVDYWCEKYKQAVKDTAKEILKWLLGKAYVNKCIDLHINEVKAKFRGDYDVEVE